MKVYKTIIPKAIYWASFFLLVNILITWYFIFNGQVLLYFWLLVLFTNLIVFLAIFSGWKRSVLLINDSKIIICRPSGWVSQTNYVFNLFEINQLEFEGRFISIGRYDSSVALKFGPIKNINDLRETLKRLLPKIVL